MGAQTRPCAHSTRLSPMLATCGSRPILSACTKPPAVAESARSWPKTPLSSAPVPERPASVASAQASMTKSPRWPSTPTCAKRPRSYASEHALSTAEAAPM